MAIAHNDSSTEVASGGIQLYAGIANFVVIAVNPDKEELHELGIKVKDEPSYRTKIKDNDTGKENEYFKLTFWVRNPDLTTRFDILLSDRSRISKTGKNQWLNNVGQSTWSEDAPEYDWWRKEGERHAYEGEEILINFVKAWANVKADDDVYFETMDKIVEGDIKEVRQLVASLKDNKVRLLIGVKDGKYQTVYMKVFGRVNPKRDDYFVKELNDEYGQFKAEFPHDLAWGTFAPKLAVVTPDSEEEAEDTPAESGGWV